MHPANTVELIVSFGIEILDMVLPMQSLAEMRASSAERVQQFRSCCLDATDVLQQLFLFFLLVKKLLQPAIRVIGI